MSVLTCPVAMREPRQGSTNRFGPQSIDTNEYVTFRWLCPDCRQRSLCTFATPDEAERWLASHLTGYCKGAKP